MKAYTETVRASLSLAAGLVLLSHVSALAGMTSFYPGGTGSDVSHELSKAGTHPLSTGLAFTPIACPEDETQETPQTCAQRPDAPFQLERMGNTVFVKSGRINYAEAVWDKTQSFVAIETLAEGELLSELKLDTSQAGTFGEQGGWSLGLRGRSVVLTWTPASDRGISFTNNRNDPNPPSYGAVTWGDLYPGFFAQTSGIGASSSSGTGSSSSLAQQSASGATVVLGGTTTFANYGNLANNLGSSLTLNNGQNGQNQFSGGNLAGSTLYPVLSAGGSLMIGSQTVGGTPNLAGSQTLGGIFGGQGSWSVMTTVGDIELSWTPVPESSTWTLLTGLSVLALAWKRRSATR